MAFADDVPFIGREKFLADLNSRWENNNILCIHGLRSVGKTRTLFRFIQWKQEDLKLQVSIDQIFQLLYVDLRTINTFEAICSNLLAQLHIELRHRSRSLSYIVTEITDAVRKSPDFTFVIIFDNAEDAIENEEAGPLLGLCTKLVKRCKNIKIILTSTTKPSYAEVAEGYASLELVPLTNSESASLLRHLTESVDYGDKFDPIVTLCEGLPLVISMVASEIAGGVSPSQMEEFLTDCRIEALSKENYTADKRVGDVYNKFINRLTQVLKDRLAVLGYIPGSFNVWEAKEMIGLFE